MLTIDIDAKQGIAKIRALSKKVKAFGGTRADITPTQVLYYLCEMRSEKLLKKMPQDMARDVRRRWAPKVEAALKKSGPAREEVIARAWRYAAYIYTDKLWMAAKRGAWGKVQDSTKAVKASAKAAEARRRPPRKPRKPRKPRDPSKPRKPRKPRKPGARRAPRTNVSENFGVRSQERDRRWYDVQKGKKKHGKRTDGELVEDGPLIEVFMGTRRISSR